MSKSTCGWVRARLALAVRADKGCLLGTAHDQSDLGGRDLITIERHIRVCESCRLHRDELERTMSVLAISAGYPPIDRSTASLWPALEARIRGGRGRVSNQASKRTTPLVGSWNLQGPSKTVLFALSASVIIAVIGSSMLRYRHNLAQSTIDGNMTPLADRLATSTSTASESSRAPESDHVAANQIDSNVDSDSSQSLESSVVGADATAVPKHGVGPHRRLGYDLDLGIPVPADAGEVKPVY